jgi:hypothetical protein
MKHIDEKTLLLALKAAKIDLELAPRRDKKTGEKYWSWSVWFRATGGSTHSSGRSKQDAFRGLRGVLRRRIEDDRHDDARNTLRRVLEDKMEEQISATLAKKFPRHYR